MSFTRTARVLFTEYDDAVYPKNTKRGKGVTTNIESEVGSKN